MNRLFRSQRSVFLLCALAVGLILGQFAYRRFQELTGKLNVVLVEQLQNQLGRAVHSGPVHVTRTGRFTIENLEIAEGKSFKNGIFLHIDRIEGQINPVTLLLKRNQPLNALESVAVTRPNVLLVHRPNGQWNFQDLLKPKGPKTAPVRFTGLATLTDGTITLRDYRSYLTHNKRPIQTRIAGLNGSLDGRGGKTMKFQASGAGTQRIGPFTVSGDYDVVDQNGTVSADLRRLAMGYWYHYFARPNPLYSLDDGVANVAASIAIEKGKPVLPSLEATVHARGAVLALSPLQTPVRSVSVDATAHGAAVQATVKGLLQNIPFQAVGRVPDLHHPVVDARASVARFEVERLPKLLTALKTGGWPGLTGPVILSARATGPTNDLRIEAEVRSPRLARQGLTAEGIDGKVALVKGLARGTLAVRQAFGGRLDARGQYQVNGPAHPWSASGNISGLIVQALAPPSAPPVSGRLSGSFNFRGTGKAVNGSARVAMAEGTVGPFSFTRAAGTITTPNGRAMNARFTMASGSVKGFDFRWLAGDAAIGAEGVTIRSATANAWQGRLKASGLVAKSGRVDLKLNADQVRLSELLEPLNQRGYTGTATFDGQLTGTAKSPLLVGHLASRNGELRGIPYSRVDGRIRAMPQLVAFSDTTLRSGGALLSLSGDLAIVNGGAGTLHATGRFRDVPGSLLARLDMEPKLTLPPALQRATLNGALQASGIFPNHLDLALNDVRLALPRGSADLNGTLAVRGNAKTLNVTASLSRVPVSVATGIELGGKPIAPLTNVPPSLAAAEVSGAVRMSGTPPNFTAAFDHVRAALPEGSVAVNGSLSLGKGRRANNLSVVIDHVPASVVNGLEISGNRPLSLPPQVKTAWVNGAATINGPLNNLRGSGNLAVGPVTLQGSEGQTYTVQQAQAGLTVSGRQLFLQNVSIQGEGLTFTGGGQISLGGGPINVTLTGEQLPLGLLQPFIGTYAQISGSGTATLMARGTLKNPEVNLQVNAAPLLVNGVRFDQLAGTVGWNGRSATIDHLALNRGDGSLFIPAGSYDTQAKTVDLSLQMSRFDVDPYMQVLDNAPFLHTPAGRQLRQALANFPEPRRGVIDGQLLVNGPLDDLSFGLGITGDALAVGGTSLNRVILDATWSKGAFNLPRLRVDAPGIHVNAFGELEPGKALGLTARVSDTEIASVIHLVSGIPALRRSSVGQQLLRGVDAFQTPIGGAINARLSLFGAPDSPQGQLDFSTTGLQIGPQPFEVAQGSFSILGSKMKVQSLRIESGDALITASGSGSFGGDLDFQLDVNNFNINLLAPWMGLPKGTTGVIDVLSVSVTGTQASPILQASLNASDLGTAGYSIDRLDAPDIRAGEGSLQIGQMALRKRAPGPGAAEFVTVISGSVPFSFSPVGFPNQGRINLHADVQEMNLGILAAFTPEVKSADGVFGGRVDITGTLSHPNATGELTLKDGVLQLARFGNRFEQLNGTVAFDQDRIALSDIRGTSSKGGGFVANGTASLVRFPQGPLQLSLKTTDDLGLTGNNVSEMMGEKFDGFVAADVEVGGTLVHPSVRGSITARNALLTLPETPPVAATAAAAFPLPNFTFREFTLTAGNNILVRRGGFSGNISGRMVVNGMMVDRQGTNPLRVNGQFTVNNGKVRVATKTFVIEDGSSVSIAYRPPEDPRVRLNIAVTTRITAYNDFDQTRQPYKVTISVTGSMENPQLDFESDPADLSRQQILAALGYQSEIQAVLQGGQEGDKALRQGLVNAFTGVVTPAIFEPLEFAVMRALNLEDFSVSYDFNTPLQVQLTKRLWSNFYFTYRRQLSGTGEDYMMKIFYRFTPRLSLSYSTDERHINTLLVEGRLRF